MVPVCPKCDVGLLILNFKDIEIDFCERCRGLWLDAGELEQLVPQAAGGGEDLLWKLLQQPGRPEPGRRYLCPRCDGRLHEIRLARTGRGDLVLERCPKGHGLWFDAEELREFLASFGAQAAAGKALERLAELFQATAGT